MVSWHSLCSSANLAFSTRGMRVITLQLTALLKLGLKWMDYNEPSWRKHGKDYFL
jgi:hypothetical protein